MDKAVAREEKPDPKVQELEAAKAAFEQAKRRTALEQGLVDAAGKATDTPPPEPKEEKPVEAKAEEPAPAKPKAKPKAKPTAPVPDPMAPLTAQIKALEEKIAALSAPKAPEPEPENPLEAIRGELAERFGDDEAGALVKALEALHAPVAQQVAQLQKLLQGASEKGARQVAKSNRKRLQEHYPALAANEAWEVFDSVVKAQAQKAPERFDSIDEWYDDVAAKLYGSIAEEADVETDETSEDEPSEEEAKHASRVAASSMTAPARAGGQERRSRLDKQREHFEYLKKHPEDKAGARRLARELGIDR